MKELYSKHDKEDKIEIVKQKVVEIQKVLDSTIHPHENHILFEVNLLDLTIVRAEFDSVPEIKWEDAVRGRISVKKTITKKDNCIYISSMNEKNCIKILKRDYNIHAS